MKHEVTLFALQLWYHSHGQDALYCARFSTVDSWKTNQIDVLCVFNRIEEIDEERYTFDKYNEQNEYKAKKDRNIH